MLRLEYFPGVSARKSLDLQGAHLVGNDGVPVRGEITRSDNIIQCASRSSDPYGLSLVWPTPTGNLQIETTRLIERSQPYHLHVELARQRLMRISLKREEWGLFDYPGMDSLAADIDRARELFLDALSNVEDGPRAARLADSSLELSLQAGDRLSMFHANVFLQRRRQAAGFSKPFLGASLGAPAPPILSTLKEALDFVRLSFRWRDIQPKDKGSNYEQYDEWVKACAKAGLAVRGGPLLSFGVQTVPDWMYLWENDHEAISDFAREHVRRTVSRYAGKVSQWIVASGLHGENVFPFNFEQIIELTRMAAVSAKDSAPRTPLVIELTQPWGEYFARNQRTIPPLVYADMVVQAGIPFDAFGIQLLFGIRSDGYHQRDLLQISSLIDRVANLGKPIQITALAVPSAGGESQADESRTCSEAGQAEWLANCLEVALSKPYVESVCFSQVVDSPGADIPHAGLLNESGKPKPAWRAICDFRKAVQPNRS